MDIQMTPLMAIKETYSIMQDSKDCLSKRSEAIQIL